MTTTERPADRDERGAVAVMVALLSVVLFSIAALAVDISMLAMQRQQLHDHIDIAAHAGAYELPADSTAALAQATQFAVSQDSTLTPAVQLYCVVASTGAAKTVRVDQIPNTCNPGPGSYNASNYPGLRCNTKICAIPCPATPTTTCNTVSVSDSKTVDYDFAPILGIENGDTGSVASTACKGPCGSEVPNPMDIVVMADRTPSMATADRQSMVNGIRGMLTTMDPALQYVALGTIHKSPKASDPSDDPGCSTANTRAKPNNGNSNGVWQAAAQVGTWIPVGFSNDYLITAGNAKAVNNNSALGRGLTCLHGQSTTGTFGTELASPMKSAARYLLDWDNNNISSLPPRAGTPRKVIVFETDGQPDETYNGGITSLGSSGDVAFGPQANSGIPNGSDAHGIAGCQGLVDVAEQAKDEGILVITIGFGGATTAGCQKRPMSQSQTSPYVRDYLAEAASPAEDGSPSAATDCNTPALRAQENTDGDYFFCATQGSELANIFKAAISQATSSIKLISLP